MLLSNRWVQLELPLKQKIKENVLKALNSQEIKVGTASAQVIESIAYVEVPRFEWQDLMTILMKNISDQSTSINLKRASLETIGFICEEIVRKVSCL